MSLRLSFRQRLRQEKRSNLLSAVTETASEILGKHRQKKKPWVTAEILDLCEKRRELRKKKIEPEGSEKYNEVNNNIKRCMERLKKAGYENSVVRLKKI